MISNFIPKVKKIILQLKEPAFLFDVWNHSTQKLIGSWDGLRFDKKVLLSYPNYLALFYFKLN